MGHDDFIDEAAFGDQRNRKPGFTRGAAYASFMENEVGVLKAGYRADFVLLDADIMTVAPRRIADIKPISTWVDGKAVYQKP